MKREDVSHHQWCTKQQGPLGGGRGQHPSNDVPIYCMIMLSSFSLLSRIIQHNSTLLVRPCSVCVELFPLIIHYSISNIFWTRLICREQYRRKYCMLVHNFPTSPVKKDASYYGHSYRHIAFFLPHLVPGASRVYMFSAYVCFLSEFKVYTTLMVYLSCSM